jgi:hypothetical protein
MELKQGVSFRVPVVLTDMSTGLGKTGVAYGDVVAYLQKQAGASASKVVGSGDWTEINSVHMPGIYDLLLSSGDTDTLGFLKYAITATGCDVYLGIIEVVGAQSLDLYRLQANRLRVTGNQAILYADNGTTPLLTWNLKDDTGSPTTNKVYERVPV